MVTSAFHKVEDFAVMTRAERLTSLLTTTFAPLALDVQDRSAAHAGHAGAREGGETHYEVVMTAPAFSGKNRIERHRLVNAALATEFDGGLHALQLRLTAPEEHK